MSNSSVNSQNDCKNEMEVFKKPMQRAPTKKRKILDEETYLKVSTMLIL